ncbi:glycosyltransferase [Coraliomargarita sp. SDUM461004]|uniref:Glycosyltransferase n=1 Tax=Thalassobacterium sedimentorum TaxID=3041258 RepID=A0ABU1AM96_9BACT|nr:glycosyltransferase [Coraliomargarita sp. SDUM461004]MDQ8195930.1 glycosyltransferase [Coraliomargarita sp. SDUM461004]
MQLDNLNIISATVDLGTTSITSAYQKLLNPQNVFCMSDGVRVGGINTLLTPSRLLWQWEKNATNTLFIFNTPTLIGGYLPKLQGCKRAAIIDWTANHPIAKGKSFKPLYDKIYRKAFANLDSIATPLPGLAKAYTDSRYQFKHTYYPLPYPELRPSPKLIESKIQLLFIGADYKRKGGDLLLNEWAKMRPKDTELTFVCPNPPIEKMDGVTFLKDIQAGTSEHQALLEEHDILILPSHTEPFGYALLEAINFGMATATTQQTGAAKIVEESGGIVGANSIETIQKTFILCNQPEVIRQISKQSCEFLEPYNQKVKQSIYDLFNK